MKHEQKIQVLASFYQFTHGPDGFRQVLSELFGEQFRFFAAYHYLNDTLLQDTDREDLEGQLESLLKAKHTARDLWAESWIEAAEDTEEASRDAYELFFSQGVTPNQIDEELAEARQQVGAHQWTEYVQKVTA